MKKIVLLFFIFLVFSMSTAGAKIRTYIDEFSGINVIESKTYDVPRSEISFKKLDLEYCVLVLMPSRGEKFTKDNSLIKVDDIKNENLVVQETIFQQYTENLMTSTVAVSVPAYIIEQIKTAHRVALKFYKDKGEPVVIILPDTVLAEWKQVIATTE